MTQHIRFLAASAALAGLILLGACAPSAVNQGIADANTACTTLVPAAEQTAQSTLGGGAANTTSTVSGYAEQACQAVAKAAANESAIDAGVAVLDGWWEDWFGANTPAAAAPAPTAAPATN